VVPGIFVIAPMCRRVTSSSMAQNKNRATSFSEVLSYFQAVTVGRMCLGIKLDTFASSRPFICRALAKLQSCCLFVGPGIFVISPMPEELRAHLWHKISLSPELFRSAFIFSGRNSGQKLYWAQVGRLTIAGFCLFSSDLLSSLFARGTRHFCHCSHVQKSYELIYSSK
jgi:hypothetical protein